MSYLKERKLFRGVVFRFLVRSDKVRKIIKLLLSFFDIRYRVFLFLFFVII